MRTRSFYYKNKIACQNSKYNNKRKTSRIYEVQDADTGENLYFFFIEY